MKKTLDLGGDVTVTPFRADSTLNRAKDRSRLTDERIAQMERCLFAAQTAQGFPGQRLLRPFREGITIGARVESPVTMPGAVPENFVVLAASAPCLLKLRNFSSL